MIKPFIIIGLNGLAGVGKDTAADFLVAQHQFSKVAFGDAIKIELADAYKISVDIFNDRKTKEIDTPTLSLEKCSNSDFVFKISENCQDHDLVTFLSLPRSPRWVMQQWGTEYRRKHFGHDYWTKKLAKRIESTAGNIVVTDVRLDNEAEFISKLEGDIWQINRRNISAVNSHSTEKGIAPYFIDQIINNYGDIRSLHILCELHLKKAIDYQTRCAWGQI